MAEITKKFVFDTNILIQPKQKFYAFDIAPTFWKQIEFLIDVGIVIVIDKVYNEIVPKSKKSYDDLSKWLKLTTKGKVLNTANRDIFSKYREIQNKMINEAPFKYWYTQNALQEFARMSNADPWLVAFASVYDCTVVTFEVLDNHTKSVIKIPNVCQVFNVKYIDLYEFMRGSGLVL
jgi:hypothetical protein